MHHIKIGFLLIAMSVSVSIVEGMQSTFNRIIKIDCEELVKKSKFSDLKPYLYKYQQSIDCVEWFTQYAQLGHCWALYMLMRDNFIRNGSGNLEIAGEDLILGLECIMKFIIRFNQDIACWKTFGQPTCVELCMGLRTKIRDWFLPMVRAERKNEFDEALARVKKWFHNFSEGKLLELNVPEKAADNYSEDNKENPILPSPICVRCMVWEKPNTLSYISVQEEWIIACQNEDNKMRFEKIRKTILDSLLAEFEEIGHARGFIESLSNEKSGYIAHLSNYVLVAGEYASPVLGAVFTAFFGAKPPTQ